MLSSPTSENNYLKQILDNSPDGIFTINTELEIRYVNPAFCSLLGFSAEELIGTSITKYLGDLKILDVCMTEVAACGRCNDQETIFTRKDGSSVHISKNVQAMCNDDGKIQEILVSIRDLTDLHRLNRDLEDSKQKLEIYNRDLESMLEDLRNTQSQLVEAEKMASLGGLVAGIAHEINTPLGISVTSASSMHEELVSLQKKFDNDSLKRSELVSFFDQANLACNILYQNLNRASELVRSFKQVAVDQSIEDRRDINLKEYVNEVLTSIGPQFKHRSITVLNRCDESINVCTNPGAIYQILSNLILNSLTHGYESTDTGTINISAEKKADHFIIEYSDDGKGIPAEHLKRIFEPFFTTRRGKGGSGLGLSIIYNIVTGTLRGSVLADSKPGKGVRFVIDIPVFDK